MLKALLPQAKKGEVASIAKGVNFTRPHPWACEAVFSSRSPVFTGGFGMMFICSLWIRNCYFLIDIWRQWSKSNIHPFSIVMGAEVWAEKPGLPSPRPPVPALPGGTQSPKPAERHNLSRESWVGPEASS